MTPTDQAKTMSMVERVARAQYDQTYSQIPWDALSSGSRGVFLRQARTAIEAMRELPDHQAIHGSSTYQATMNHILSMGGMEEMRAAWNAVIDASLSEEGE